MSNSNLVLLVFALLPPAAVLGFRHLVRRYRSKPSLPVLLAGNGLLLVAVLGLVLFGGEVYYRFVYDQTDGFQVGLVSTRWIERHYAKNNYKMRDDVDYELRIASGKRRLTILGDSYTNGYGIAEVENRFANLLRRDHPEWEVQVIAVDGLDSGPLLRRLHRMLVAGYELDVVLYAYCLNDISDLVTELDVAARRLYEEKPGFFVQNSYFLNTYYYRLRVAFDEELGQYFDLVAAAYDEPTWSRHEKRLAQIQELVASHDGELYVATFPFFELRDSPDYVSIHRQMDEYWRGRGVPHLDLLETYRDFPTEALIVNPFDTHPNEQGHRIAGEALSEFLPFDR